MVSMHGASVSDLRAAAGQLAGEADHLDSAAASLTRDLGALRWLGGVAVRFSDAWNSGHKNRLVATSGFLRENSDRLNRQADEQERASNSLGAGSTAAGTSAAAAAPSSKASRLGSESSRRSLLTRADNMLRNSTYLSQFPGAMAEVGRWRESFGDRVPTEAEAAQFERYLAAIVMANYQTRIVHDAAQLAANEFVEMTKAAGDAAEGLATFGQGPDGVAGAILGFAGDQLHGVVDAKVIDPAADHLASMTADQLAATAAGRMDAQLAAMAGHAQTTDVALHNNPFALALARYNESASRIDWAQATGSISDAFSLVTGDGSVLDSALRNSLKALPGGVSTAVGGALDIAAIAGSSAQANYHYQAGLMALNVALGGVQNFNNFATTVVDIG